MSQSDGPGRAPDKTPIRMLHDRVLVVLDKEAGERRSSAGIVIPATAAMCSRWSMTRSSVGSSASTNVGRTFIPITPPVAAIPRRCSSLRFR